MSKTALVFATTNFEEVEMLSVVDVLRRGNIDVKIVSLTGELEVKGAHDIVVTADLLFKDTLKADIFVLPGGGVLDQYLDNKNLQNLLIEQNEKDKLIGAICAAPCLLGEIGLLDNKRAVCYPGMEEYLESSIVTENPVEIDGNIITSKAPATALLFAISILEELDEEKASEVADDMHMEFLYNL